MRRRGRPPSEPGAGRGQANPRLLDKLTALTTERDRVGPTPPARSASNPSKTPVLSGQSDGSTTLSRRTSTPLLTDRPGPWQAYQMLGQQPGGQPGPAAAVQTQSSPPQAPVPLLLTSGSCMQRLQQLLHNYDATFRDQAILLIAACRTQYAAEPAKDLVFLFCHQIVCLAFTDTNVTPREIWRFPNIGAALELLFRMLIPFPRDSVAGKDYMKYFSDFPAPNATSSQWNLYPALLEETLQFIHRFCENNVGFTQTCIASQRLPLPDDIEGFFGVRSAGLQKVIYRWIVTDHCQLPPNSPNIVQHAEVFRQKQTLMENNVRLQPQHPAGHPTQQQHVLQPPYLQHLTQPNQQQQTQHLPPQYQQQRPQHYPLPSPQHAQQQFRHNFHSLQQSGQPRHSTSMPGRSARPPSTGGAMNESASKGPVGNVTARTPSTRPTLAPSIPTIQPPAAQPRSVPTLPATRFFPEPGVNTGQVVPANPSRLALHQAHLRTPKLVAQQLLIQPPAAKERAYRYFHSFALEPRRFASNERVLTWKFDVSEQDAARRPLRTQPTAPHEYSLLTVELDTRIFRLRCVQGSLPTETEWRSWPTKSTYWPSDVFFECNGELLEERRKLGHGKDLPIDVTQFVRAGSNEVRMVSNMDSKAPVTGFSVAVEIVVVEMYNKIKQDCMQRRMPREQTLTAIAAGMQSEDDDLRLTFATIGLRDPMLGSRIWDIPMRGPDCRHREVWDLETFLNSRGRRPDDEVSMTDVWRCPICKEDARPNVIMVDEWMLDVRRDLENSGQLNVRSIRVEANGSWTVVEEKGDEPSASRTMSKQSEGIKNPDGTSLTPKVGVIELDGEDV